MANQATQAVTAPAQSAVGVAVDSVCGRSLAEAQSSLEQIFAQTAEAEKLMAKGEDARDQADALLLDWLCQWETIDGKSVKMRREQVDSKGEKVLDKDGKPVMVFVPISYPEYKKVIEWATAAYFDRGAPTTDAAEKQFQRQCNRLVELGWRRPVSQNKDAARMAEKRAKEAEKWAGMSDGDLAEKAEELGKQGSVKASKERTAVLAELARREKPELDKKQAEIKAMADQAKKLISEWVKAGSDESLDRLTRVVLALS